MKKKNIIITGGLGFIGSNLTELLLKNGFRVILIDYMGIGSSKHNLKNHKDLIINKFNIRNAKLFKKCFLKYKPIGIFNLAAETHVDRSIYNPKPFIESNILGVFSIIETMRSLKLHKNFKLIHISTDEVYGDISLNKKSKENDVYNPSSPYASSKAASDLLIKSYVRTYKLPCIITNCTNNFGPKQFPEKLIPKTILRAINNKDIPIYGNGKNQRDWIYVEDHCKVLLKLFYKGKIGENYNIGSKTVLNNIDIVKKILSLVKKRFKIKSSSKIIFVKDRKGHDFRYALNTSKLDKIYKFKNHKNFNEAMINTIEWYLKNKKWIKSLKIKKNIYNL
jgi:dTDP-glucose 4,6-dehydratase